MGGAYRFNEAFVEAGATEWRMSASVWISIGVLDAAMAQVRGRRRQRHGAVRRPTDLAEERQQGSDAVM